MKVPLLLLVLCLTTSCASWKTQPIVPPPPRVDCSERAPADPLPKSAPRFLALPKAGATEAEWARYVASLHSRWVGYSVRLIGAYTSVVQQRVETADCLDRERAAGRLR